MKTILFIIIGMIITISSVYAEEASTSPIGLSAGATYYSTYLWRGAYFYTEGEGAFLPSVSWNVLNSGLTLGVSMELSDRYLFEKDGEKSSSSGYTLQSFDAGIGYSAELKPVTIAANVWYWDYYRSDKYTNIDASMFTGYINIGLAVPLNPFVAFTYDYYTDKDYAATTNKDYYIQFGLGHSIEFTKESVVKLGVVAGYYNKKTTEIKGFSDITSSISVSITGGAVNYTSGFNYVFVPKGDFRDLAPADRNKFLATFAATYSL